MAGGDISFRVDDAQLAEIQAIFADAPKEIPKVLYRAINRASRKIQSLVAKTASKLLGIKQKIIRKRIWYRKATRRRLYATVRGGVVGFLMADFDPRQVAKGVQIKLRKRQLVAGAFVARMPKGHVGVYRRKPSARPRPPKGHALPIKEQRTPSVTQAVMEVAALPSIVREGQEVLSKRVVAEAQRILERRAAKAAAAGDE